MNNFLFIESPSALFGTLEIFNVYGMRAYQEQIDGTTTIAINTSDLPKGTYFLRFSDEEHSSQGTKKVVKF